MLDACRQNEMIELVADAMVTDFEEDSDKVGVATADGRTFSGAALVAADGLRSLFRQKRIAMTSILSATSRSEPSCR